MAIEVGLLRERTIRALWSAGFEVHVSDPGEHDTNSPSSRPDLVVLAASDTADPYAITAAWTSSRLARPRAVVVIEAGEEHWHGAAPGGPGEHLAINLGEVTTWLESSADEEA